jgi:hypothetical protein
MPDFALFLDTTNMSLSVREERREGKGPGKLQCTTGGDAPYLRMMGSNSQCESRRDRSKSDMRERRACGSPAYVLGSGRPRGPLRVRRSDAKGNDVALGFG